MTQTNLTNPFASDLPSVGVVGQFQKPTGVVQDPIISPLPYAPTSYSAPFGANLTAAITGLNTALALSNSNTILTFNSQEVVAMQNTYTLLSAIHANSHASPFPFTQAQLQDIMVSVYAIQNSQNTGAYITAADLAAPNGNVNNNITFGSANTGWFPDGAQTLTVNDTYMIADYPGSGGFAWSNTANAADWSVLNTADMEAFSDQTIAVATPPFGGVVSFGLQSIEFFSDTGQSGPNTYQAVPQTAQNYGLSAVFSVTQFMNSLAFLGQNQTGACHVFLLNNYVPQIISTPDIDAIINSFEVVYDAVGYAYDNNGHQFYQLTFPTANRSFLYDGTVDKWSEVQSGVTTQYGRHVTSQSVTFNTVTIAGDCATGNVYLLDPSNATDNGFLVRREFTTRSINLEGTTFSVAQLWIEVNTGAGNNYNPNAANPVVALYWSKDNGNTWNGPRMKSMGAVGQSGKRVLWRNVGGKTRDMRFKFVVTDPVPVTFVRGLAVIKPGTG